MSRSTREIGLFGAGGLALLILVLRLAWPMVYRYDTTFWRATGLRPFALRTNRLTGSRDIRFPGDEWLRLVTDSDSRVVAKTAESVQ